MAVALPHILLRLEGGRCGRPFLLVMLIGIVASVGLLLAVLHGIECMLWAGAYLWLAATQSPTDAILYSLDSMTTRGSSGLMLEEQWRIMGALEAANGMLLFGISTAAIFAMMQIVRPMILPNFPEMGRR